MRRVLEFGMRWLGVASLAAAAVGCVDKEKCDEAIRVTRDALSKDQPDIARQWRERAWKICDDSAITTALDKEIVDKEAEIKKRAEDAQKAVVTAAQKRMNLAQQAWLGFDKLEEKERTMERLQAHQQKAKRMSQGLPPEYGGQLEDYNAAQFARRKAAVEQATAKK